MQVPLNELLYALSKALDFVERELLGVTSNHGKRTAYVSGQVCRYMGMSKADIFDMAGCAMLHDNALTSYMLEAGPGDLARLEKFQNHCVKGEENALAFPFVNDVSGIVLYHHENWDGSGFHGLMGNEIPLRAIILRMVDNMDLRLRMGHNRTGLEQKIRNHARSFSGTLYSPDAVDALLSVINAELLEKLRDENIHKVLKNDVPSVKVRLSTEQMLKICGMFAYIVDAKSHYTRLHSSGIAEKVARLSKVFRLGGELTNKLVIAAYLHDIGKLSTPRSILEKPGSFTKEELDVMKNHVSVTEELLSEVEGLEDITTWCACHHEKLTGAGYPHERRASDMGFECRLITCCDIYQALTENRPYRNGMQHDEAMKIMNKMVLDGEIDGDIVKEIAKEFA